MVKYYFKKSYQDKTGSKPSGLKKPSIISNIKKCFLSRFLLKAFLSFLTCIILIAVFLFFLLPGFMPSGKSANTVPEATAGSAGALIQKNLFAQEASFSDHAQNYDYILVIDESGSMRKNDPYNMRIDAAKLFVYLAEVLNKGNRVLVSGFGAETNIYLPLTYVQANEKEISAAISKIKSNQGLTDMKGALERIKNLLDERQEKKKTVVIFLTDGSLTISDIPPQKSEKETMDRDTTRTTQSQQDSGDSPRDSTQSQDDKTDQVLKGEEDYLTSYKKALLDLCYEYKKSGIVINPIAFTSEAEIEILEKMASITGGVCYKPQKATDLKEPFIDILKDLSKRFIKIENQEKQGKLSGIIDVKDYIKELVVISLKNNFNRSPSVALKDPSGASASYDEVIKEDILNIVKINSPAEGSWSYAVDGDGIFVYDIVDYILNEPKFLFYTSGATVPLKATIQEGQDKHYTNNIDDFTLNALISFHGSSQAENIELKIIQNDENNEDSQSILSGSFIAKESGGHYDIAFVMTHLSTDSASIRNASIDIYDFPLKISVVEPSESSYIIGQEIKIVLNAQIDSKSSDAPDDGVYLMTFNVYGLQGIIARDIMLLDNGIGADEKAGDNLYSGSYSNTSVKDIHRIEFFISDIGQASEMTEEVSTGLFAEFELTEEKEPQTTAETEEKLPTETSVSTFAVETIEKVNGDKTKELGWLEKLPFYIYIIAAAVVIIVLIVLIIYFTVIKPRKRKS